MAAQQPALLFLVVCWAWNVPVAFVTLRNRSQLRHYFAGPKMMVGPIDLSAKPQAVTFRLPKDVLEKWSGTKRRQTSSGRSSYHAPFLCAKIVPGFSQNAETTKQANAPTKYRPTKENGATISFLLGYFNLPSFLPCRSFFRAACSNTGMVLKTVQKVLIIEVGSLKERTLFRNAIH